MAIVRKIKVKQEDGSAIVYDIGANAENVVLQSGGDLETEVNSKVSQDLTETVDNNGIKLPALYMTQNGMPFAPLTTASQVRRADGTPLEVDGKIKLDGGAKVWSFTVPAANWVDETVDGVTMKKNTVVAPGMTTDTFLTSFQLGSVDALNEDAKIAAMAWKFCDTAAGQIIFYSDNDITSDFHLTAIEPITE